MSSATGDAGSVAVGRSLRMPWMSGQPAASSKKDGAPPLRPLSRDLEPHNDFVPFREEELRQSVAQRFELQVAASPARIALQGERERLHLRCAQPCGQPGSAGHSRTARRRLGTGRALPRTRRVGDHRRARRAESGKVLRAHGPLLAARRAGHVLEDSQAALLVGDSRTATAARNWAPAELSDAEHG